MASALVGISFPWIETMALAKKALSAILQYCEIMEASPVFKRNKESASDFDSSVEFLISISTDMDATECAEILQKISQDVPRIRQESQLDLKLLLYEQLIMMTPQLTLPHPDLQYDLLTLRLSSDAWGQYEHPVLKMTLRELADQRKENLNVEFIMQGQNLFD